MERKEEKLKEGFALLKINTDASLEAAGQAYRKLVKASHPDRFVYDKRKQQQAEERLKRINVAYEQVRFYLKTKQKETVKPYDSPVRPADIHVDVHAEMDAFFRTVFQKIKKLRFFSFFRNKKCPQRKPVQRKRASETAHTHFKDVLRDAQRQTYSRVRQNASPAGFPKTTGGMGKNAACDKLRERARRQAYGGRRALHHGDTGPVGAIQPIRRVRGIGRSR